jgi:hypothetical protein
MYRNEKNEFLNFDEKLFSPDPDGFPDIDTTLEQQIDAPGTGSGGSDGGEGGKSYQ